MTRTDIGDYNAVLEPDLDFFLNWFVLAERVGGTVGLTREAGLVITLPGPIAVQVAAGLTAEDFPHCFVEPGTDSVLIPRL